MVIFSKVISDAQKEAAAQLEAAQTDLSLRLRHRSRKLCGCTGSRNPGGIFRSGSARKNKSRI